MQLILLFLLCSGLIGVSDGTDSKRLLLNDPNIFQDRLNRMESMWAILNNTVNQQAVTMQRQDSKHQQQNSKIQQQDSKIQQQDSKIQQQERLIQQQAAEIKQLQSFVSSSKGSGSTYVIWGRKQCPPNNYTEQVYSGFAGGGMYADSGAAADYVCLPPDPDFGKTSAYDSGRMYGAEYEGHTNDWSFNSLNEDVPCAVCRIVMATTSIMIPGKNICYSGWTREYYGYLASGSYDHAAASSYVCVDIHPQYLNAGVGDLNGKLFYPVIAKCGTLQCPPYINNYPLTCVVCSK